MDQAPPSLPATMLAWTHSQAGSPSKVLSLSADVKTPTVQKPTDVLVRVSHASLNPGGLILLQLCPFFFRSKPSIPETDFSGEVVAAGPAALESGRISVGDSVFGSIGVAPHIKEGSGSLAEYVRVDMATLTRKPDRHATDAEVAGLGVAGCTAVALMEKAGLQTGNSVLVNGASGGIGSMVVQMARDEVGVNGRVVAICSGANATMARELGADEVIDYQICHPLPDYLAKNFSDRRFNAVIDAYGVQGLYSRCGDYLSSGKPFVTVGVAHKEYTYSSMFGAVCRMMKNILTSFLPSNSKRKYVQVAATVNSEAMEKLRSMMERGALRVPIDSCWDMKDALKAYERMSSRRAKGKVIVKVRQS